MKKLTLFFLILLVQLPNAFAESATVDLSPENTFTSGIEGPALSEEKILFAVNMKEEGTVGVISPHSEPQVLFKLPQGGVGNAIVLNKGLMFVADYKNHILWKYDFKTRELKNHIQNTQWNQPNDMVLTKGGIFYLTDPNWSADTGTLWMVSQNKKVKLLEDKMGTTNGIALSPGEKFLYVNESSQRKIWRYTLKNKIPKDKKLFYSFQDGALDGMKCDTKGNLYVTRYGMGLVAVLSSEGKLIKEYSLKGKRPSNLVLNGKNIFVTVQDRGTVEVISLR